MLSKEGMRYEGINSWTGNEIHIRYPSLFHPPFLTKSGFWERSAGPENLVCFIVIYSEGHIIMYRECYIVCHW